MSEITPLPKPAHYEFVANGSIDHIFDWYSLAQLQAYGTAEYQRALKDAAKFFKLNDTSIFWGSQAAEHLRALGESK